MKLVLGAALVLLAASDALSGDLPQSYAEARAIWQRTWDNPEYRKYAVEFSQFNNHFHLDERNGCYGMASGSVTLMLMISRKDGAEFAEIDRVFTDVNNAKARCFEKSYQGVATKAPPFFPFVLQMEMK
jgi:hypothetical protein